MAVFSLVMSSVITAVYLEQTDRLNRATLSDKLSHLQSRIKNQRLIWTTDTDHMLHIIAWSGLLNLNEPLRKQKLLAFFSSQAESMGFQGIVIRDATNGKLLFDYWLTIEVPRLQETLQKNHPLWYDARHTTLYTIEQRVANPPGQHLQIFFFKAWDSAMLYRLSFPDTTTFISLGDAPLLSSAGRLALESAPRGTDKYAEQTLNGIKYQEGIAQIEELTTLNGARLPVNLLVRAPLSNVLPISTVLGASVGLTILFGLLLFTVIGRWLRQLGTRLDGLARAALQFKNEQVGGISAETVRLLEQADAGRSDQISVVAQELSGLMDSAALRDAEQRAYLQTLDLLQDAVIEFTPDGHMLRATDAWKTLTGVEDIDECSIINCVHPEDSAGLLEHISALNYQQKEQVNIRFRMFRENDPSKHYWVEGRFAPVKLNDKVVSIRGVVRDITSTYHQERQITYMALHDSLTDLPNRVLLEDRMEMAISRATRKGLRVGLGFIDIDHFKQVNDNFGHKIGDRMLKEVTKRLGAALRGTDTLSRWGGDEFVVLCPDLNSLEDAREITQKLSTLANEAITIDGTDFPFTFSAGFAVFPDDAANADTLLSQADRAMFYAKAQGRNNIQFFNNIAGKETGRQSFYIQSRLMQAVQADQIQCWLQPLVSAQTGAVIGAEALARWHEPEQGWIPPSVFIPMAESMGLIDSVGQAVWRQALHALTLLPDNHRLSVNLSKRQLFSNTIVKQLVEDVARANIEPGLIMLEITESIALSDVSYARERIVELDAKGFGISIDDFGVGYSSLSQLHEIPADELKLDISFIKRIHEKSGRSMAAAIISIAKSLDLECVAEGVEDAHTAELLGTMGVEVLQGYHFAKPMPIDDYLDWLATRTSLKNQD